MKILKLCACLFLSVVFLMGVCGCSMNEISSTNEKANTEYVLNERQIEILRSEGLPTEYSELNSSQKRNIKAIEEKFLYLDGKYDFEVSYIGYFLSENSEEDYLLVYPSGFNKSLDSFKVYGSKDNGFADTYNYVSVRKPVQDIVCDFIESVVNSERVHVYSTIEKTTLEGNVISLNDLQGNITAEHCVFVEVSSGNNLDIDNIEIQIKQWLLSNEIYGSVYLNLFTDDIDLLTEYNYTHYLSSEYRSAYKVIYNNP